MVKDNEFNIIDQLINTIHTTCSILNLLDQYNIECNTINDIHENIKKIYAKNIDPVKNSQDIDLAIEDIEKFQKHIQYQFNITNRK